MSNPFSRRSLAKLGAAALAAPALPAVAVPPAQASYVFPKDFIWAAATAAYQIEGAAAEDGRKPSTWDTYSHTPGNIFQNQTGDVACDSYHRYKEDVQLLKSLGVNAYRFSISWSRIFPDGDGKPNPKGLDFYSRLVDELLAAGIRPFATMFHWDLPQSLEDRLGGWRSRDTAKIFADYVAYTSKHLAPRVKDFFTINEFACYIDEGYGSGTKAPGHKIPRAQFCQTRHFALLAHGLAAQALRANAPKAQIGIAENPTLCIPVIETPEHIAASQKAMRDLNAHYITTILEGKYPEAYLAREGANAPKFTPDEMKIISTPLDFVGFNIYAPAWVRADSSPAGYAMVPNSPSYPRMASSWLTVGPDIAYWTARHCADLWKVKAVYITENGASAEDVVAPDGKVYDTDRLMYVRHHLRAAHRAVAEGYPLKGYFWWSLLDNFEWNDGYSKRFGMVHVDFKTQKRTPKLSADFYRETIKAGRVL